MKLDAIEFFFLIANSGRVRAFSMSKNFEPFWQFFSGIAVAHPAIYTAAKVLEKISVVINHQSRPSVFTTDGAIHFSAKAIYKYLVAIADAKNGLTNIEYLGIRFWSILCIDT